VTESPPGTGSTDRRDGDWNRQASTVDWEGWIAEANAADAERAAARAAAAATPPNQFPAPQFPGQPFPSAQPSAHQFPTGQPNYPPPTGPGHYLPSGHPQPGVPFQVQILAKPSLDVFSVLALIFGILPTIPLGLIFGIIGIVRTAHPARRGRGLAVTGLLLSLLWFALAVAIPILLNTGDSRSAASGGSVTRATTMAPMQLRAGDCYNDTVLTNQQAPASTAVGTVKVVPCSQPHNAVVFAVTTLPTGAWISGTDKLTIANRQCRPLAIGYFNGIVLNPNLKLGAFVPQQAQWERGLHNAPCIVVDPDKSFVGDVRQDR
jgi:hypothetical protein